MKVGQIRSKNALPTYGYLEMTFTFRILEAKREGFKETQRFPVNGTVTGTSKIFPNSKDSRNVRQAKHKMKINAIYDGVKQTFPNGTFTPYDVQILDYDFVYYLDDYKIVKKKDKKGKELEYEQYSEVWKIVDGKERRRTKIYRKDAEVLEMEEYEVFQHRVEST